jgi:hypothetical protein
LPAKTGWFGYGISTLVYEFWSSYCCNRDIMHLFISSCLKMP